jgi:hypothetical protein
MYGKSFVGPANPDHAATQPSDAVGFLYPPDFNGRMAHGLKKRVGRSLPEFRRIAELIEASPPGKPPDPT